MPHGFADPHVASHTTRYLSKGVLAVDSLGIFPSRALARAVDHPMLKRIHAKPEADHKLNAGNVVHTKHATGIGKQR